MIPFLLYLWWSNDTLHWNTNVLFLFILKLVLNRHGAVARWIKLTFLLIYRKFCFNPSSCEDLSFSEEPLKGLLGRGLLRKLLCAEVSSQRAVPEGRFIIDWLQRLATKLYGEPETDATEKEAPSKLAEQASTTLSPSIFLDCPVHNLADSQRWFLQTWNEKIVPVLRSRRIRSSNTNSPNVSPRYGDRRFQNTNSWKKGTASTDPTEWVLATYPWPPSSEYGSQHLNR